MQHWVEPARRNAARLLESCLYPPRFRHVQILDISCSPPPDRPRRPWFSSHPACSTSHCHFCPLVPGLRFSVLRRLTCLAHSYHCDRSRQSLAGLVAVSCRRFELVGREENHSCGRTAVKRCVVGFGCHCHLRNSRQVGGTGSSSLKWRGRWARC
jgi:hypothetical protein